MNITAAAYTLFMNPSTLSRQISILEQECGALLFDRTRRTFLLTEAGVKLQEEGMALLRLARQITEGMRNTSGSVTGRVGIYTVPGFFPCVDHLFVSMARTHPGVELVFNHLKMTDLASSLNNDIADFGITYEALFEPDPRFVIELLDTEPFVVLCTHEHPFAVRTEVTFKECLRETVFYGMNYPLFRQAEFKTDNLPENLETFRYRMLLERGIIIIPEGFAKTCLPELRRVTIRDAELVNRIVLVYKRDKPRRSACRAFLDEAARYLELCCQG
jgi:DNA-binding transcriptional LysR family regulator